MENHQIFICPGSSNVVSLAVLSSLKFFSESVERRVYTNRAVLLNFILIQGGEI